MKNILAENLLRIGVKNLKHYEMTSYINEQAEIYTTRYDQWAYDKSADASRDSASTYIKVPRGSTFNRVGNLVQVNGYMGQDWSTSGVAPADTLKTDLLYPNKRNKITSNLKLFTQPKTLTWSTKSFATLNDQAGREYYIVDGNLVIVLINTFATTQEKAGLLQTAKKQYQLT